MAYPELFCGVQEVPNLISPSIRQAVIGLQLWKRNVVRVIRLLSVTSPGYIINRKGVYAVVVTNQCGGASDTRIADYKQCACEFYIPSAFTPNNDGRNDLFKPLFRCALSNYSMHIYDRFGRLVFSSKNNTAGWNGTLNSQPQDNGCYVWMVSYKDDLTNTNVYKNGTVLLIR